jgi:LysR family hydrogen peroxide-inducible transcriptional activator
MTAKQKKNIRYFKSPAPVREISLVTYRHFMKKKLIDVLKNEIITSIPHEMMESSRNHIVEID